MRLHNTFSGVAFPQAWKWIQEVVNGNLDLENMRWRLVDYTSNAVADTEDTVAHTLGRTPVGFVVLSINKPGVVYQSNDSSPSQLKLKCSAADANVRLVVI